MVGSEINGQYGPALKWKMLESPQPFFFARGFGQNLNTVLNKRLLWTVNR
jgi:hypothetical protein